MQYDKVWITWEKQPRNLSMARVFGAEYKQIVSSKKGISRYIFCMSETLKVLKKSDYRLVFVQNPSLVLSAFSVLLKPIFRYKLIIDAHNAGVRPNEGNNWLLQKFNIAILKGADCVIVTNKKLMHYLSEYNVNCAAVTDPLPELASPTSVAHSNFIFVICSWAKDEPIDAYLETAKSMPELNFVFSGNYRKILSQSDVDSLPSNVILAGFVSDSEYVGLLIDAQAVLDLTLRDDCLVCGAYEAIAASKKVILSDTLVNRELFGEAAFYTKNSSEELQACINETINVDATEKINHFKSGYQQKLDVAKAQVLTKVDYLCSE